MKISCVSDYHPLSTSRFLSPHLPSGLQQQRELPLQPRVGTPLLREARPGGQRGQRACPVRQWVSFVWFFVSPPPSPLHYLALQPPMAQAEEPALCRRLSLSPTKCYSRRTGFFLLSFLSFPAWQEIHLAKRSSLFFHSPPPHTLLCGLIMGSVPWMRCVVSHIK